MAIDPEGRVYIGTGDATFDDATKSLGNAIVSVKMDANGELQLVDYYAPPNANWMFRRDLDVNVTPMVFDYQGRKFLVGTSKECRLQVLDRDNLGGRDHRTARTSRRSSATMHRLSTAKACGARWRHGSMAKADSG